MKSSRSTIKSRKPSGSVKKGRPVAAGAKVKSAKQSKISAPSQKAKKSSRTDSALSSDALSDERRAHADTQRLLAEARDHALQKTRECEEIKDRYEAALRGAQVYAFAQDRELRYTWIYNPLEPNAADEMLGRTDAELGSSPEQDAVIAVKRKVLATGTPANSDAAFITPERRAEFALHIDPILSDSGEIDGILGTAIDVSRVRSLESERRRLTDELATVAQRFELALRGSNVSVFTQDRGLRYTSVSKPMFGRDVAAIKGKADSELMPASSAQAMIALKQEVLARGSSRNAELRIEGSDAPYWYDFHLEPMRDVSGTVIGITGTAVDITERKQSESHLRLLLRELTHRSKNLLAVIQAMARQTAKHSGDLQSFVERFGERVQALARSHDLLVAESWRSVSLRDLVHAQLSYYIDREPDVIGIQGPDIKLRPEAAQSLGLALHELATNAAKFGAMSKSGGRVDISWQEVVRDADFSAAQTPARPASEKDGFELTWRESGGPKVALPKRRGFGSVAIEQNLPRALDAEVSLDFDAEGVTCRIAVPRTQLVART